ncbi:MAG: polysaccharide pyruvyl transferase family protein [Victivallaceae bacterium]
MQAQGNDYVREMCDLLESLLRRNYGVVLFPNATRGDDMDKTHNNDLPLLKQILSRLSSNDVSSLVAFNQSLNASQIHAVINTCDAVVTSRFHAMVGALSCGKPIIVLGWSHKYLEIMRLFGQEDMVLDHKHSNAAMLMEMIDKLVKELNQRSQQILKSLPSVKASSQKQIAYVQTLLGDSK